MYYRIIRGLSEHFHYKAKKSGESEQIGVNPLARRKGKSERKTKADRNAFHTSDLP